MARFNPDHQLILDQMLLGLQGVRPGKMFGYPAYYAGQKLSICIVENNVGFKLPAERAEKLSAEDAKITFFQPMGRRKMREWVQVTPDAPKDLQDYKSLFKESIDYVSTGQGTSAEDT